MPAIVISAICILNVAGMVYIKNFPHRIRLQSQTRIDERTLEVAHTRHAPLHAVGKHIDGFLIESVYASRNVFCAIISLVAKSRDVQVVVGLHIQRLLIVDIVGHRHHSVITFISLHRLDIWAEILLAEDSVDRCQAEASFWDYP